LIQIAVAYRPGESIPSALVIKIRITYSSTSPLKTKTCTSHRAECWWHYSPQSC